MDSLIFIETNKGIAAVRRRRHAENKYITQVWFRDREGRWNRYHLLNTWDEGLFSSGMLESIYRHTPHELVKRENWW